MSLKRKGLISSIVVAIILPILLPSNPSRTTSVLRYKYGFPVNYITFFQTKSSSKWLGSNLFTGNAGFSINPLNLLINILIIYFVGTYVLKVARKLSNNK